MEYSLHLNVQHNQSKTKKLPIRWHIFLFLISFIIIVCRRPDALFNAQFWAEDGKIWYANAYKLGVIHTLFSTQSGYLQTVSSLTAALVAITIQILPVNLISSSRFFPVTPNLTTRLFLAFIYLAIPNSFEINANISNAQWHLALLAYMVLVAVPSSVPVWRFFDIVVILLSALSRPFSLLLIPIATLCWRLRPQKWALFLLLLLSIGAFIQGIVILFTPYASCLQAPLGATLERFFKITGGQVFISALIGRNGNLWVFNNFSNWYTLISIIVTIAGLAVLLYSLLNAPLELRLFIIFATSMLAASLASFLASRTIPQWEVLTSPGVGQRYYFVPMLAFITTLVWIVGRKNHRYLRISAMLAVTMLFGISLDWQHPAFSDFKFSEYSRQFVESPRGLR